MAFHIHLTSKNQTAIDDQETMILGKIAVSSFIVEFDLATEGIPQTYRMFVFQKEDGVRVMTFKINERGETIPIEPKDELKKLIHGITTTFCTKFTPSLIRLMEEAGGTVQ